MEKIETQVPCSPEQKIKFDALRGRVAQAANGETFRIPDALHFARDLMNAAGMLLTETAKASFHAGFEDFGIQAVATGANGVGTFETRLNNIIYQIVMTYDTEFAEAVRKREAESRERTKAREKNYFTRPSRAELLAACEKWPERVPCDFEDTNFQKWLFAEWCENEHKKISDLPLDAGLWTGRDWLEYFENTPFH